MDGTRSARIVLPASGSDSAEVRVEHQSRGTRITRALVFLVVSWALVPVVVLVPPHFLWPLIAFGVGIYLARREWRGEYVVRSFEGSCPRCGEPLELEAGARIRARHRLECFNCHREPELVLDETGETGERRETAEPGETEEPRG